MVEYLAAFCTGLSLLSDLCDDDRDGRGTIRRRTAGNGGLSAQCRSGQKNGLLVKDACVDRRDICLLRYLAGIAYCFCGGAATAARDEKCLLLFCNLIFYLFAVSLYRIVYGVMQSQTGDYGRSGDGSSDFALAGFTDSGIYAIYFRASCIDRERGQSVGTVRRHGAAVGGSINFVPAYMELPGDIYRKKLFHQWYYCVCCIDRDGIFDLYA